MGPDEKRAGEHWHNQGNILEGAGLQVRSENWAKLLYRRVKKKSRKPAAEGSVMLGTIMSAQHTAGVCVSTE